MDFFLIMLRNVCLWLWFILIYKNYFFVIIGLVNFSISLFTKIWRWLLLVEVLESFIPKFSFWLSNISSFYLFTVTSIFCDLAVSGNHILKLSGSSVWANCLTGSDIKNIEIYRNKVHSYALWWNLIWKNYMLCLT